MNLGTDGLFTPVLVYKNGVLYNYYRQSVRLKCPIYLVQCVDVRPPETDRPNRFLSPSAVTLSRPLKISNMYPPLLDMSSSSSLSDHARDPLTSDERVLSSV